MEDSGSIDDTCVRCRSVLMGKTSHTDLNACSGSLNVTGAS